jgi:3-oxoadipate enol-lactonase
MDMIKIGEQTLHYRIDGDAKGAPIVFANSLGTDFRLWDKVVALLPPGLRILRFDKRGHGLSSCPSGDYSMDELVDDCAGLIEKLGFQNCLFVGLSIGGLIAQGLAARHPQLLRAMVISNSAAKIGSAELWQERMDALRTGGIEALADNIIERWFAREFQQKHAQELLAWRNMLTRTPLHGYVGCCAAIAASDFTESTARLTLPTLLIAGNEDGSTPPDLMRATGDLIAGSRFALIDDAGHLPCVEQPIEYLRLLNDFIRECEHV